MREIVLGNDFAQQLSKVEIEVVDDPALKAMFVDDLSYSVST